MDEQTIYDTVCAHLAQQKQRAASNGKCLYRTPDGMRCAVGCLIPDELYDPRMDDPYLFSTAIESVINEFPQLCSLFSNVRPILLIKLQEVHDSQRHIGDPDGLRERLSEVAKELGLTPGAEQAITEWH